MPSLSFLIMNRLEIGNFADGIFIKNDIDSQNFSKFGLSILQIWILVTCIGKDFVPIFPLEIF